MKKLTYEQLNKIKEDFSKGVKQKELSQIFGVSQQTINYHTSEELKIKVNERKRKNYKKLNKEERKKLYLKQKKYNALYFKNRYQTDPEFRARQQERARNYKRKKENGK